MTGITFQWKCKRLKLPCHLENGKSSSDFYNRQKLEFLSTHFRPHAALPFKKFFERRVPDVTLVRD